MSGPAVGVVTQARSTSTRLPGKVLLKAAGRSMLDHHVDRLHAAGLRVLVATTTNREDDDVAALGEARGLETWRGNEHDVLERFAGCVRAFGLDVVVRVTSDCPLIDGSVVAEGISKFLELQDPWAYVSNGILRTYPRGMDFEVFSASALLQAHEYARSSIEREHVTPYLYAGDVPRAALHHLTRNSDASGYRLTLDTEDDLRLLVTLIEEHGALDLDVDGLVRLLDQHPELRSMNAHVEQKKLGI